MSKVQNIFKNLGKAPSQIHKPNVYSQSLEETKSKGSYEKSVEALAPTTYQQSNKLNFQFAKWYANLYHVVSAGLGLATVAMLAFIFSGAGAVVDGSSLPIAVIYTIAVFTLVILSMVLFGIEIFKGSLAVSVFKNLVTGDKVKITAVIGLVLVVLFSILVSAVGGAILSYEMNDKSTQISTSYNVQSDSLRKQHDDNLQDINSSIDSYKKNLNKGDYWAKYATREKLDKAIEKKNNLLTATKNDITSVQTAKEKEISLNSSEGKNYALISALVVLFLEILAILAYWFQYVYHANCEREAVNFAVLTPIVEVVNNTNMPNSELSQIKDLLQNLLTGGGGLQLAGNTVQSNNKVGFSFGANKDTNDSRITTLVNDLRSDSNLIHEGTKICVHCEKAFYPKIHFQKYCKEECRITAWELKTGKKFNKKKGGKN